MCGPCVAWRWPDEQLGIRQTGRFAPVTWAYVVERAKGIEPS
jgi:hypothetical protein